MAKLQVVDARRKCTCSVSVAGDYTEISTCKRHGVTYLLLNDSTSYTAKQLEEKSYRDETHGAVLSSMPEDFWD